MLAHFIVVTKINLDLLSPTKMKIKEMRIREYNSTACLTPAETREKQDQVYLLLEESSPDGRSTSGVWATKIAL